MNPDTRNKYDKNYTRNIFDNDDISMKSEDSITEICRIGDATEFVINNYTVT